MRHWYDWYQLWKQQTEYPLYLMRYEDIMNDPEPTLKGALEFMLNVEDITGTRLHKFLQTVVGLEKRPQKYEPRKGQVGKNRHSPERTKVIEDACGSFCLDLYP